tara:strand:+ start:1159 stop:1335 length:177 start_codon:yes stop_codon:yes gene_type:complete
MTKVYYNVWTIVEKVTITDDDEIYEDIDDTSVKVGKTETLNQATDIQKQLSKEYNSIA